MIEIEIKNALSSKVGLQNGISKKVFDDFLAKNNTLVKTVFSSKSKPGYAFQNLPDDKKAIRKIKKFAATQINKWDNIIVLGIGGSALGGIALRDGIMGTYQHLSKKPHLFFLDNVDPDLVSDLYSSVNFKKSLFIVISKSGGTVEPMALYSYTKKILKKKKLNPKKHFIFITDPELGLLRPIGDDEGITMFDVPQKVGGRFSVLSSVGLLPAALTGIDINALIRGAKKMREKIQKSKPQSNPALALACLQYLLDKKKSKSITVMMPYSSNLFRFGDWYRQLLAESIGKNEKTGPVPINALGTTDQHSQVQLYTEGPNDKWFIFLKINKFKNQLGIGKDLPDKLSFLNGKKLNQIMDAAYTGTAESLAKNSHPNITLKLNKLDAENLGGLFMLFEFQVALLGLLYKVNAFNQPGVEQQKIITKQILSKKL